MIEFPDIFTPVHKTYCGFSSIQLFGPDLVFTHIHKPTGLVSQRILVYGYRLFVCEDLNGFFIHGAQVVPRHQRGCQHAPHGKMSDVFVAGHSAVAYFKHFGVVPVSRTGIRVQIGHYINDLQYTNTSPVENSPVNVPDIGSNTPQMSDTFAPFPGLVFTPFTNTENYGASAFFQGIAHGFVCGAGILTLIGTPVVFQIINTPFGILTCILKLISPAARASLAGMGTGTGIDAQPESPGMDIIGQVFHP